MTQIVTADCAQVFGLEPAPFIEGHRELGDESSVDSKPSYHPWLRVHGQRLLGPEIATPDPRAHQGPLRTPRGSMIPVPHPHHYSRV